MSRKFRIRGSKKRVSSKITLLTMTLACVAIIIVGLTLNISGGPLKSVAGYVFVPMQKGINNAGLWIFDKTNEFKTLNEVLAENEDLKQQVSDLTSELNTIKLEQYELDNYRELFELDEKYPSYEKIAASVIAKDSGNWFSTFIIDKGSKSGIKVGQNVLAGSGLVGIITEVGPNYAKVRSIIDDSSNVSAMVTSTEDNFNVSGDLLAMNEDKVISFSELKDEDDKVAVGDAVVTSYVSDQYQQGILIGYIASIEDNSNNLTKSGTITPIVDFQHIENVLVISDMKSDIFSTENDTETNSEEE